MSSDYKNILAALARVESRLAAVEKALGAQVKSDAPKPTYREPLKDLIQIGPGQYRYRTPEDDLLEVAAGAEDSK